MKMVQISLLLIASNLSGEALASESSAKASITVCELARFPKSYQSRHIVVSGEVKGGLDRLLLRDRSCPNRPISLLISNDVAQRTDVAPLWSAIYREGNIGTVGKRIRATVLGTFSYERGEWPRGLLSVSSVRNFAIEH